jgi:hypothetical protein
MKIRLERDLQQMTQCGYNTSCECGRSYIDETVRPLALGLHEHRQDFKKGFLQDTVLAQHTYEEGQRVNWDAGRILEIESSNNYRKCKYE